MNFNPVGGYTNCYVKDYDKNILLNTNLDELFKRFSFTDLKFVYDAVKAKPGILLDKLLKDGERLVTITFTKGVFLAIIMIWTKTLLLTS